MVVVGERRKRKFRIVGLGDVASVDVVVGFVMGNGDVVVVVVVGVDTSSCCQRLCSRPGPCQHLKLYSHLWTQTHV